MQTIPAGGYQRIAGIPSGRTSLKLKISPLTSRYGKQARDLPERIPYSSVARFGCNTLFRNSSREESLVPLHKN